MYRRIEIAFAVWFVLLIVVPFTPPLQACDLAGLLGSAHHHGATASPDASVTPTDAGTCDPPAAPLQLLDVSPAAGRLGRAPRLAIAFTELPSLHHQQSILRV